MKNETTNNRINEAKKATSDLLVMITNYLDSNHDHS